MTRSSAKKSAAAAGGDKKAANPADEDLRALLTAFGDGQSGGSDSKDAVLAIAATINAKCVERIEAFEAVAEHPNEWNAFFHRVLELIADEKLPFVEQNALVSFLINCANNLEFEVVRRRVMEIASLLSWQHLSDKKREELFRSDKTWGDLYKKLTAQMRKKAEPDRSRILFAASTVWKLIQRVKRVLDDVDSENDSIDPHAISFIEKTTLLLVDLLAQLSCRRFVHALVDWSQLIVHATLSQFYLTEPGTLFFKLVQMLVFYFRFEVNNSNGEALTTAEVEQRHYSFVNRLQVVAFKNFREKCNEFCLMSVGSVNTRKFFEKEFAKWTADDLYQIAYELNLVPARDENVDAERDRSTRFLTDAKYLREILIFHCAKPQFQLDKINSQPLYPNEEIVWDENLVPYEEYNGQGVLPLNRLNLQFLTLHDYLLRNFNLFQMESTYEIRHDLEDVMFRMRPWKHESQEAVVWGGWARMALPISSSRIVSVGKPSVGQTAPSEVRADVEVNLPKRGDLRREWEQLRRNDVLFLLTVAATEPVGTKFDVRKPFKQQFRVAAARGCEVIGMLNADKNVIDEMDTTAVRELAGDSRVFRVRLDPNQYEQDAEKTNLYFSFNLLVRRDPKANNFKAVLSTIRQLLNTKCVVPDWLNDVLLGYGDPASAHYSKRGAGVTIPTLEFNDTFLDFAHLKASFPEAEIRCDAEEPRPPFTLTFNALKPQHGQEKRDDSILVECEAENPVQKLLGVERRQNAIRFTPTQVEAIKSGMEPGLTMVVGPPGTGKTDVAVQIISNIYHNWPEERTLIVTHSNQALNQLFEKIIALDVDERHLLRLGHGEEALETSKDFSRYGRVNYVLKERLDLLKLVTKLKHVMKAVGDVDATCETAGYFFRYTITRAWEDFLEELEYRQQPNEQAACTKENADQNGREEGGGDAKMAEPLPADFVAKSFPFRDFFHNAAQLFVGEDLAVDLERAHACWERIEEIFQKLDEFRAFELLRNGRERSDYLLVREAKVIAMTCTHAALRRKELVELGFRYDNVIMEEAAQILEVETFIPLLLQEPSEGVDRLKRWIMIGDHNQLPPVVQNVAYQKYANLEQSLFTRFIRLGVPHVQLDAQGRARPEIAALYNWRYKRLGDLPHVHEAPEFQRANPGFRFAYQFVDVPDFNGVGEATPSAHFYQNLGEAEYAVALFTYMRILGYPAEKISILTTYNGQRSLLMDVLAKRCQSNPLIGMPASVSTVDKYQGQQNDFVILSLVRTKLVGHLRDVRRLVVAVSRARLGLYVLGRQSLFQRCAELAPVFRKFAERPTRLQLFPAEAYESERKLADVPAEKPVEIVDAEHMANFVVQFYTSNFDFLRAKHEQLMAERAAAERAAREQEEETMEVEDTSAAHQAIGATNGAEQPAEATADGQPDGAAAKAPERPKRGAENAEAVILFEQVDFERLQDPGNFGK